MDTAIISGLFGLGTTIITALAHNEYVSRKRLQEKLLQSQRDVLFLLEVERIHCDKHRELLGASFKVRARNEAASRGFTWSGANTPGRARAAEVRRASAFKTTMAAHAAMVLKRSVFAIAGHIGTLASSTANRVRASRTATMRSPTTTTSQPD
jgi:hypothetical protein